MVKGKPPAKDAKDSSANLGFEAKLWLAADKLRNNMDAAEYKHVVLGLIFLKYISDTFEEHRAKLVAGKGDYAGANPEDQDEYKAENVFWVPKEARWSYLQASAKQPTIGKVVDDAMVAIERDNARLKGVLPKEYARPGLDKHRLGELIDLIGTITLIRGTDESQKSHSSHRSLDLLGRVYEYFLTRFASAEGKNGGQFYTPQCVVRVLVEMLAPTKGSRVYDPCFSSGPRLVMAAEFRRTHGGSATDISLFGQDAAPTARRFALMNFALRGIEADIGPEHADTFRRALIEADLVDCMVAMPGQLFYSTQIPVCLWFLAKDKSHKSNKSHTTYRDRRRQTLFIDARKLGTLMDRVHRELTDADIGKIVTTYHAWRGDSFGVPPSGGRGRVNAELRTYEDLPGFCKSATTAEIAAHGHVLTPGRYVGAEEIADDGDPFEEKMPRLVAELHAQFAESAKLEQAIKANMRGLGYGG